MTEREKRIEEMVLDGAKCSHITESWNCKRCKYSPCGARRTCENLVDAGYRKVRPNIDFVLTAGDISSIVERARKEAVKEAVEKTVFPIIREKYLPSVKVEFIKTYIFKHFGVEVEE